MLLGGLAAGMVLFIVSVGLSVTMGLMGFVNLAHGGFAMIGGYVIVLSMNRLGIPFVPALVLGFVVDRRRQRGVRAAALFAALPRGRARSGAVHHRTGVRHDRLGDARGRPENQPLIAAATGCRARSISASCTYRTYSIFLIVVGVVDRARALARLRAHPHRRADPRRGRQPPHGGIARHQHRPAVHPHLRLRQRHGRARRRARRRIPRPRSAISAEVSGATS